MCMPAERLRANQGTGRVLKPIRAPRTQTDSGTSYSNQFGHLQLDLPVGKKKKKLGKILENSQPSRRTSHGRKGTGTGAHRTSWCTQMFRLPKARQGGGFTVKQGAPTNDEDNVTRKTRTSTLMSENGNRHTSSPLKRFGK